MIAAARPGIRRDSSHTTIVTAVPPYSWTTLPDPTTGFNAWSIHSTGASEPSQFGVEIAYVNPSTGATGTGTGAIARSGSSGNYNFTNTAVGVVAPSTYTRVTIWSGASAFSGTIIAEWIL